MNIIERITVTALLVVASIAPAAAGRRDICVPEIDGSAGVSALAMLAAASLIAYRRRT